MLSHFIEVTASGDRLETPPAKDQTSEADECQKNGKKLHGVPFPAALCIR